MITHTPYTIGKRYDLLGRFRVPGVPGEFEVRFNKERVKRPLLIVVHDKWQQADRREQIAPLMVLQYEADGREKCIEQIDADAVPAGDLNFSNILKSQAVELCRKLVGWNSLGHVAAYN
ncbi:hypothetical protein ACW6AV_003421 [Edwardsiella piscicida]|uniref:Uncharacterized protein n=1 Tax=Edwardsiella anguillarum ET080813 TaxID=667120 RepID=A0A076LZ74_9GAMM|nr:MULTISPECIES: hypothetical protein [Edwardsiella]EKG9744412.1 hypothetical protein [Salmonella enterica]AIJ10659.1 Hypothetical protein ETEE_p1068 [Edwardsiella anguillarum ET080813]EKS7763312.1 hypothetical protein [Edwardsiella ictaluri]EKS7789727.1 hypothetical protein [Edwardsiella ictaluri]EKS7817100.1 hypothetical protein [Edwardsiella ictaluri]